MDEIQNLLTRGVEKIYPSRQELEKVLRSGKKLRLYQGFDPSMPSLHLGNFVGLMKLRQLQKLGHKVIFLVGDFTGMIGDPTDKLATRKMLTREETLKNSQTWKDQASRVLNFEGDNPVKMLFNSEWLDKVNFKDLIGYTSHFTFQQLIERDMFQKRLKEDKPIYLHEFLYPVAQAIDCIVMDVDLEIGGNDQTFNMLAGRTLMKGIKNKEKFVLSTKLLVDKDGDKVGKTTGNALFLDSTPENFYGGIMSFPDEVIALAFELLTEVDLEGLEAKIKQDPMGEKKRLAFEIVKLLWSEEDTQKAQDIFEKTFQKKESPNLEVKVIKNAKLEDALVELNLAASKNEAKRLIQQGGVDVEEEKVVDSNFKLPENKEMIIKVGKTKFVKIKKCI
ncbi:tyrosine--tRNA ligase [Candidatus Shapirobacteria bacterium CG03_land_8_20_14_0_80_40_19]|uniref:Tyrosine--tRNA ligase n=5 Tax=Candidatus Shapironibacteriota TaxID=1752721 RepID=A0A2M7BCD4_9BACT|nr:MAG: tyrosine--tRNA ligase [Candidatus Shapirobacteria bacterium CG03_land_8_20_14_0_80_40_19]PJC28742.1 MAG: tyrosine--tRNA ligase [Candidatus Shapirobacteria bacterium CG_4_9_14_0_2_um_filter_40_11]PJC76953.1 MAG: tyrosine--tRNA ligase [Candidatus Shapirobacteria bacterium CG_4_8_14_3_um_filter_39_11]